MEEEVTNDLSTLTFVPNSQEFRGNEDDFLVHIPRNIADRQELFDAFVNGLHLPGYFGQNWDALEEVCRDFSWVKSRRIIILHEDLPQFGEDDLRVYLDILMNCVQDWKPGEEHELVVVFPSACREVIRRIVQA
jgi:RNAse (barnase) inhibitor barstar